MDIPGKPTRIAAPTGVLRSAALPADKGLPFEKVKPVEPSLFAIQQDIEQRRERIARKLEP